MGGKRVRETEKKARILTFLTSVVIGLSLGTRVLLANVLSGMVGPVGIWAAIPIDWALADLYGIWYYIHSFGRAKT